MRRRFVVVLLCVLAPASVAKAADPDPAEFTPRGYEFCGWQDFVDGGWAMEWREELTGVYLVAFADGMSCTAARRNIKRVRYSKKTRAPVRAGYRCRTLVSGHEYSDVRCVRTGAARKFRFQTGA